MLARVDSTFYCFLNQGNRIVQHSRCGLYLVEVEGLLPGHRAVDPGLHEGGPLVLELVSPALVRLAHLGHAGVDGLEI